MCIRDRLRAGPPAITPVPSGALLSNTSALPNFPIMSYGILSVSYTHLDVYKRQSHNYAQLANLFQQYISGWQVGFPYIFDSNFFVTDVYKRQILTHSLYCICVNFATLIY